jgi:quercetin dioxygenase-like cupin family protein
MKTRNITWALLTSAMVLGCGASVYAADAPKDNKGFTASKTTVVELGPEIDGMAGRQLRMRLLTIEPGGYIGLHSHKDRPAVVYFIQGTDTVTNADGTSKTFHAGDTSAATKDTTHWHHNDGKDNVQLIAVDVFKTPQHAAK